jgi:hypothetical protein
MPVIEHLEDDAFKAAEIIVLLVLVVVIAAAAYAIWKLPGIPSLSDLWNKLKGLWKGGGNVAGGKKEGDPLANSSPDDVFGGDDPYDIHTGIGG